MSKIFEVRAAVRCQWRLFFGEAEAEKERQKLLTEYDNGFTGVLPTCYRIVTAGLCLRDRLLDT